MSDAFNTIKKVSLPIPLLEKVKAALCGDRCFKPHVIVDLVMNRIRAFDTAAAYMSGPDNFREFLATAWSSQTESMVFCFKPGYWEELNALQNRLNISTGDLMRLFICSYLFPPGRRPSASKTWRLSLPSGKPTSTTSCLPGLLWSF
jgi:hypothetical protein